MLRRQGDDQHARADSRALDWQSTSYPMSNGHTLAADLAHAGLQHDGVRTDTLATVVNDR
ncbi:hypothetical protein [Pseudonocardia sp. WMMC193]|uniref:hypothetical protein n=1 Tax=Pseudonocardia sp. WMMC193 TaxID=2911965 RepID=UPI001F3AC471|nr:hypothetical protein [Pseudonocardia sp. WMMC193]MCF7550779.1 hypothetical protein [Pseudonocardia sp. WMMC193]